MQVLSLTSPGTEQLEPADAIIVAREANQFLAVKKNPARFAGLAAIPISAPEKAQSFEHLVMRALHDVGTSVCHSEMTGKRPRE